MANGLEVRTPFLDYELVNFIFSLPGDYKIKMESGAGGQRCVQDFLPKKLYRRPKKALEVPLLKWLE